jgi:hypothetical protein
MDENTHQVDEAKLTVLSFDIGHKSTEPLPVPTQTEVEVPSTEGSTLIQVNAVTWPHFVLWRTCSQLKSWVFHIRTHSSSPAAV